MPDEIQIADSKIDPEQFYTSNVYERKTGIPARLTRRAVKLGTLKASDFDGRWFRIKGSDFLDWVEATRVKQGSTVKDRVAAAIRRRNSISREAA